MTSRMMTRPEWGGWTLSRGGCLAFVDRGCAYDWETSRLTSSAAVLNCIAQVSHKPWATDAVLAGLVRALDDLLNVQTTLCSCGQDTTLTKSEIRERVRRYRENPRKGQL